MRSDSPIKALISGGLRSRSLGALPKRTPQYRESHDQVWLPKISLPRMSKNQQHPGRSFLVGCLTKTGI
jgi:hypothetical protein